MIFSLVLTCVLAVVTASVAAYGLQPREILGGNCGDDVQWTFDTNSLVMIINGTGPVNNYSSDSNPWGDSVKKSLETVYIDEGITSIGDNVFHDAINLASVTIPSSIEYREKVRNR